MCQVVLPASRFVLPIYVYHGKKLSARKEKHQNWFIRMWGRKETEKGERKLRNNKIKDCAAYFNHWILICCCWTGILHEISSSRFRDGKVFSSLHRRGCYRGRGNIYAKSLFVAFSLVIHSYLASKLSFLCSPSALLHPRAPLFTIDNANCRPKIP